VDKSKPAVAGTVAGSSSSGGGGGGGMGGMMGGGGGGGGGLGGLAGAIAAAQAARNAGNSVHSALGMSKSQPGNNNTNNSSKPPTPGGGGGGGMTAREMLGHANKARMAGNQIHSALGLRDPPSAASASHSHSSGGPPPPPPPPPGGPGGVDFAELKRGVGGMLGVGKSVGTPMLRNAGERAGGEFAFFEFGSDFGPSDHRQTGTEISL
jgi:hypothetical protein